MAIFGCHSCGVDLTKYASYEQSPCATCKMCKQYTSTHRAALFDSGQDFEPSDQDEDGNTHDVIDQSSYNDAYGKPKPNSKLDADAAQLRSLKTAIEKQVFIAASGLIIKMVKLAKFNPVMFEVVIKKMQYPYMSYSQIGNSMTPKCSKQNVLYHLKHAVTMFPDLHSALLTDTRFSSGRYALQTIANRSRQDLGEQRIQGILYGDVNPAFKAMGMKEINDIISAPFMASEQALNFNPYIPDEMEQ